MTSLEERLLLVMSVRRWLVAVAVLAFLSPLMFFAGVYYEGWQTHRRAEQVQKDMAAVVEKDLAKMLGGK